MLTDIQIQNVRQVKSYKSFNIDFICRFDKAWEEMQELFKDCKIDLSRIEIVQKENQ